MPALLTLGIVGAVAQLVAGSLGMGYGVLTTSALLALGTAPAVASASVHLAEVGTSASLWASHRRLGNVDARLVRRIGVPGAVGAFVGAVGLTALPAPVSRVLMAGVLVPLGGYLVVRFALGPEVRPATSRGGPPRRLLIPLGLVGGVVDAVGGGGWGPVTTTSLLASGRVPPRTVVGSVDAAKLLVTTAASAGFVLALGLNAVPVRVVLVLLASGVLVAPLAAWLVARLPHLVLGTAAGGLVVLVNLPPLFSSTGATPAAAHVVTAVAVALWLPALGWSVLRSRRAPQHAPSLPETADA